MDVDPAVARQLQLAIERRDVEGLRASCAELAASGDTQVINNCIYDGASLLITAVRYEDPLCVQVLLEHGADVHYNNPTRSIFYLGTALHEAVKRGSVPIVGMLLRHDANPFMSNANNDTPMDLAMKAGYATMVDMFAERALVRLSLTAKCRVFAMSIATAGGRYKPCRAMVVPHLAFDANTTMYKQMKRVYIFLGGAIRPKVTITYQAAEVNVTDYRIQLTVLDPDGCAIHQPDGGSLLRTQMYYPLAMIPAIFLLSVFGIFIMYGANYAATSSNSHFLLQTEGRHQVEAWYRAFNQASSGGSSGMYGGYMGGYGSYGMYGGGSYRGANIEAMRESAAQNPTSTLYFKPRRGLDMLEYDTFVRALEGPRNELLRTFYERTGRTELNTPADVPGSSAGLPLAAAGELQILPAPPKTLRQANKEAMCVVCLARPSQYGLVHADTMHVCLCNDCLHAGLRGRPCPVCRQPVEAIAPTKPGLEAPPVPKSKKPGQEPAVEALPLPPAPKSKQV